MGETISDPENEPDEEVTEEPETPDVPENPEAPEETETPDETDISDETELPEETEGSEETKEPVEEPAVEPEEPVASEENPDSEQLEVDGDSINAATPTEIEIAVEQYEKDGTPGEGNTPATDKLLEGDAVPAEVTFVDGTSADDKKALGGDRPVKFRVDMKDGWKEDFKVAYSLKKSGGEEATFKDITAKDGEYTIETDVKASGSGEDAKPAGYSGNITIKITAVPVKSTVKLSEAAASGVNVYLAESGAPTDKAITNTAGQTLTYAESTADVTLAVSGLGKKYNTIRVYVDGWEKEGKTVEALPDTVTKDDKVYHLFTFNPSELYSFEKNEDTDVIVALDEGQDAHALALALDSAREGKWAASAVTPQADSTKTYITVNADGDAFDISGISGGLNEDNYKNVGTEAAPKTPVLAFVVTADADAKLKLKDEEPVKAELVDEEGEVAQTLDATFTEAVTGDNPVPAHYEIDLSAITAGFTGDMTLFVKADTEPDTELDGVHTISFEGDGLKNVEIGKKNAYSFDELTNPYTAKMDDITVGIRPNDGYSLKNGTDYNEDTGNHEQKIVTVSYDKVYALTKKADDTSVKATVKVEGEEIPVESDFYDEEYFATTFKFADIDYMDADWKNGLPEGVTADAINTTGMTDAGETAYTLENIVVNVETVLESGISGTVTVKSDSMDYVVSGDGISEISRGRYEISEDAELLTLTVTSGVKPSVNYSGWKTAAVKKGETEGTYVAEIPVSELAKNWWDGDGIYDTITIAKGRKTLTIYERRDTGEYGYLYEGVEVNGNSLEDNASIELAEGQDANVTITAPAGTELVSVAKEVGEDGEREEVALGEDKSSVTFPVTMTDDVSVYVDLKSVYEATVTVGDDEAEQDKDGVYIIRTGSKNIEVSLFNGGDAENILYAKVYDGNEIAVTKAATAGNVATIAEINEADTGVLRVDLASKITKKVVASVQIKQEPAASGLVIKDVKNNAVTTVSLMADSKAEFSVEAADGRLDYAEGNIGVEVVAKADDAPAAAPAASNDAVEVNYADGKLIVTAKPAKEGKDAAAVIRFYDKAKRQAATGDADKICLMAEAITVNTTNPSIIGEKPVVKEATGTDKTLKVELSTTEKVVKPASDNKVLYKVTVEGTLAGTLTDADKVQYIEKTAWGKDSQIAKIVVDNTTVDAQGNPVEGSAKDYSLKVELVQTTKQTENLRGDALTAAVKAEATANTLALGGQEAELTKISTRDPLYETKLKMKPASVTVYTGQTLGKVAKPQTQAQFDKKTGYTVVPYVQFVDTKTGVLLGEASNETEEDVARYYEDEDTSWEATVDGNGNVRIGYDGYATSAQYLPKNIGLKVTAEYPEQAYASTAIVKISVANGIQNINFVSGTYRSVYKQPNKAATLKLTPILNWGSKDQAPKKKTLTFAMGDEDGYLPEDGGSINAEVASKVKVNPKNGAVTVDKTYDIAKGSTFTVVATAADYEGNDETCEVYVDITGEAQSFGDVVIVDGYGYVIARDGDTLTADDLYAGRSHDGLYVRALKPGTEKKGQYSELVYDDGTNDYVEGVSYTSGAKTALSVDAVNGELSFIKPNSKPVKLTVAAADGSKSKKEISVTVKGYSEVGLGIAGEEANNGSAYDRYECNPDVTSLTYDGAMGAKFYLKPYVKANGEWTPYSNYTNLTVKVTGAKIVNKPKDGVSWLDIVMSSGKATIVVTDKADKNVTKTYTIEQKPATDMKAKAPSIKQIGKLTAADVDRAREYGDVEVAFQVTNKNSDPKNNARQYVFLTPDYTKTKVVNDLVEWSRAKSYFLDGNSTLIEQIDDNGRFKLNLNVFERETFDIVPGAYTLIATVGTYDNGKFAPAAKGVNLKISIPGKAAKNSLTVKGKYTLDASAMAPVDLASGKNIVTDYRWTLTNAADENGSYAMNKIDPKTGKANKFTDYFEVKWMDDTFKLGLKKNLTKDQIGYITSKDAKADCEGYVTVSSYAYEDYLLTKDMKITVSFKDVKYAAKTVEPSVYVGADATVQIFETAKSTDPIALAGAVIVPDDKNGGATLSAATGVETDGESLKVKLASAEAGKSYKVTFKVLAADSAYADMKVEGAKDFKKLAEEYGRTVVATIKVSDKGDKTKNKVAVTGKAFKITADNFTDAATNTYLLDVFVKNAIEGTDIKEAKVAEKVKDKDYEGKDIVSAVYKDGKVTLTVKRDKLVEANAVKTGKFKFNKSVDVPVEFTFTDTAVTKATVNLKVTLPNPMTFEKAVEAATKLEPVIGSMKDDKLFTNDAGMKADLEGRITNAINSAIPKDAQAVVSRPIALTQVTQEGAKAYKTTVTVQKAAAKAEGDYEHEYIITKAEAIATTIDDLVSEIESLVEEDYAHLDNDYTEELLMSDMLDALAKNGVKVPVDLGVSVKKGSFKLKNATTERDGRVSAEIQIRNRRNLSNNAIAEIYLTIEKLGNQIDNGERVKEALKPMNKMGEKGINYAQILAGDGDIEAALRDVILPAAKSAIRNPDINVDKGFLKRDADPDGDNPKKTAEDKKVDVDFKKPVSGVETGWVSFTLLLSMDGMKDYRLTCNFEVQMSLQDKVNPIVEEYIKALLEGETKLEAIKTAEYDKDKHAFTATLDETKKDENIEETLLAWKEKQVEAGEKDKLVQKIAEEFASDWDILESVTLTTDAKVRAWAQVNPTTSAVMTKVINQTKTVEKKKDETIEQFAERVYDKMEENQDEYITKLKEELKKNGVSEDPTFGMIGDSEGTLTMRIDYTTGGYDDQQYTVSLKGLAKDATGEKK